MPWCCASAPRTCRGSRTSRASTAIATLRSSPWTAWDWGLRLGAEYLNAKNFTTVNTLAASVYGTSAIVTGSGAVPVSDKADGVSGWASYSFAAQWSVFGRYDQVKLSKDVASGLKDTYFNLGMSYKPIKALDSALVYKNEKVDNGSASLSGGNAGGSYAIGGANGQHSGKFDEIGLYAQWTF